ncbi:hypothetical protein BROUX41_002951 [Berkeleyomyces rouxiae]|uniref:uncharacterized protein n=1 Tax=Berkeleyomyces rouxiae TaxID=2035830 RepID=UPI003B79752C
MSFHFPFPIPAVEAVNFSVDSSSKWADQIKQRAAAPVSLPVQDPLPSYWVREACDAYSNEALPDTADVVIIGSGISGAMIAWYLLHESKGEPHSILMLEARDVCSGATGRNGGHTKSALYCGYSGSGDEDETLKIIRLQVANINGLHELSNALEIDCDQEKCDTIDVFYNKDTWNRSKASIIQLEKDTANSLGVTHSIHEPRELPARHSCFSTSQELQAQGIIEYPAGRISGYKLVRGVLDKCVDRGMRIITRCPVTGLDNSQGGGWRVTTPRGNVRCQRVVLATNGYAAAISSAFHKVVIPVRGDVVAIRATPSVESSMANNSMSFMHTEHDFDYMTIQPKLGPESSKTIILGGGLSHGPLGAVSSFGNTDDSTVDRGTQEYLKGLLPRVFGEHWGTDDAARRIEIGWSGVMGFTLDEAPMVGEVPGQPGLWASVAFQGHGMALALKCAEGLVKMMVGKEDDLAWFPKSFRLSEERLKTDGFWHGFGQEQE